MRRRTRRAAWCRRASAPNRSGAGAPAPAHARLGTSPSPAHARLHLLQPRLQLIPARARGAAAGRAQQLACLRLLPVLGEQRHLRDARLVPGGAARWARVEDGPPVGEGVLAVALRRGRARRAAERLGRRPVRLEHLLVERAGRRGVAGAEIEVREDDSVAPIAPLSHEDGVDLPRQRERGRLLGGRPAPWSGGVAPAATTAPRSAARAPSPFSAASRAKARSAASTSLRPSLPFPSMATRHSRSPRCARAAKGPGPTCAYSAWARLHSPRARCSSARR